MRAILEGHRPTRQQLVLRLQVSHPAVDGTALLQLRMKDGGEPGDEDLLAITVWSKNGELLYSSNWNGVITQEQDLDGGNLQVH